MRSFKSLQTKINNIKSWQASVVIAVVGFVIYFDGLMNPFQGDDTDQIVKSLPVHSITHIKLLFEGGTFYAGQGLVPLEGEYFRPLMTTVFSLIYTVFGAHPFYYHLFQLMICIGSAILLFLFFRYSFKPVLALFLALVFLVHPINSQVVFAIPSMQDALFFFFGILAMWILIRFKSIRSLAFVALCLLLCLLAKESGVLFVIMALIYLFWWDRKRILAFSGIMVVPLALYIVLRLHAIHGVPNPYGGPIDRLGLASRLMTAPSILLFYISKFLFPWKLATTYYWTYPSFSVRHVLLPLLIDLAVVALVAYGAVMIYRKATSAMYYSYLFFAIWTALGLIMTLQLTPLDMTACETWFYFSMAGVLGMIGVVVSVFKVRIKPIWLLVLMIAVIGILGFRTAMRGQDYTSPYKLSLIDTANSPGNYRADNIIENDLMSQGQYAEAAPYGKNAISVYPTFSGYINLGAIDANIDNYNAAENAYAASIKYSNPNTVVQSYEGVAVLTLLTGNPTTDQKFLIKAVTLFPHNSLLWMYLALFEGKYNNNTAAKVAVKSAVLYGQVPPEVYDNIMNDHTFTITIGGKIVTV